MVTFKEKISELNKKLIYIQSVQPILDKELLYSDCTENFLTPCEPNAFEELSIRFRTAKANVDSVLMCIDGKELPLSLLASGTNFDIYEIKYRIEDRPIKYCFKVVTGFEGCYFDRAGVCDEIRQMYLFQITPGFKTPDWAKGAVMYQIYVDRFFNGDETNDVLQNEYVYIDEYTDKVNDWNKYPATMGVREFYGGDLQGVMDKMDYLEKLGVEVIYFNPLFVSPSNHKYDIQDYDYIDPHFGKIVKDEGEVLANGVMDNKQASRYITRVTDKANLEASNELFANLVREAHRRNIKVIIDGVFNHCGSFNKWMDKERIYQDQIGYADGAYVSKDSPYHSFFKFYEENEDKWPYNNSYDGWWGHDTLPKLNYEGSKELEEYILYIARKWVSPPYNVDGWRLDVAADLGHSSDYNHEFWKKFRRAVKEANPNAIILAEHYGNPESWLSGDQWDTVMNYDAFMEPLTWFLTGMEKHSDSKQENLLGDATGFFRNMTYYMSRFQTPSLMVAMNQLSNHDHSRFLTRTNGVVGRVAYLGPEAANEGVKKAVMKEAVIVQMTWPGAPTIYYGDEAGVCGWTDPDNRRTYPWGHEDLELIEFHKDVIRIHKRNEALRKGSFRPLHEDYNVIAFGRFYLDNILFTVINNNDYEKEVKFSVRALGLGYEEDVERLMLSSENNYNAGVLRSHISNGIFTATMPPRSGAIYRKVTE
ncbi:MAG: glycoside hydrolase family 13 protein [Clostridiales bacterium]|nr:glycoside hydrolase family 13 protein [Clostridiales bacterium]